jgi:hypothetical protein
VKRLLGFAVLLFSGLFAATDNIAFSDVPTGHWAADPVSRAVNLRIVRGYPDGTFRGEEKVSRYETITYLSNLSLTMEALVDQKLSGLAPTGAVSARSLVELQNEIDALKTEVAALQGRDPDFSLPGLLKDSLTLDIYVRDYTRHIKPLDFYFSPVTELPPEPLVPRVTFLLGRERGLNGYRFKLAENSASAEGWAGRHLLPELWIKIKGSLGPGQQINSWDQRVDERPGNTVGLELGAWGLELGLAQTYIGEVEVDYYQNMPPAYSPEDRYLSRTSSALKYKIPVELPLLNTATLEYGVDNYYTAAEGFYEYNLRTLRYLTGLRFDLNDLFSIRTRALKEYQRFYELDQVSYDHEKLERPAQYYDLVFAAGDIFNRGTNWTLMYAYKDAYLGKNGLREDAPGINLLGYASCGYQTLIAEMPSADVITEAGLKITQELGRDFFAELAYIYGSAAPDKKLNPDTDTTYVYEQHLLALNWRVQANGVLYLAHEQTDLADSAVSRRQDQFYEVINRLGVRLTF